MPSADSRPGEGSEPIERSSVRKTPNTTSAADEQDDDAGGERDFA